MALPIKVLYIRRRHQNELLLINLIKGYTCIYEAINITSAIDTIESKKLFDIVILDVQIKVTPDEAEKLTDGSNSTKIGNFYLDAGFNAGIFLYEKYLKKHLPNAKIIFVSPREKIGHLEAFIEKEKLTYFHESLGPANIVDKIEKLFVEKV